MNADFKKMMVESLPRLRAYALFLTRDGSRADDLVQESLCRAMKSWQQFAPGTHFHAWMYRIIRNQFITNLRKNRRPMVDLEDVPASCLAQPAQQETHIMVRHLSRALDKLHPKLRDAVILVCSTGLTYEEAAQVLECSVGTVKSRVWRGRRFLELEMLGDDAEKQGVLDTPKLSARRLKPQANVANIPAEVS